jgi:hypothetical protein
MSAIGQLKMTWGRRATYPLVALFAYLLGLGLYHIGFELPGFGPGPRSWLIGVIAALVFVFRFGRPVTYTGPTIAVILAKLAVGVLILLASALGGRIVFTFFPPWDQTVGVVLGLVAGFAAIRYVAGSDGFARFIYHRGRRMSDAAEVAESLARARHEAEERARALNQPPPKTLRWAGNILPWSTAEGQFIVMGSPGSGKTLQQYDLLRCVVPHVKPGSDRRILFYDVKAETRSQIEAMGPVCPVLTLNPFDKRCVAWDIARDLDSLGELETYVRPFLPDRQGHGNEGFFVNSARSIIIAVFGMLIQRGPHWTLRDVVLLCQQAARLRPTLLGDPTWGPIVRDAFEPASTFSNVKNELDLALRPLHAIANLWDRANQKISLRHWLTNESSILLFGAPPRNEDATKTINRVMFETLVRESLSLGSSNGEDRFWFFIDELKDAGRIEGLPRLISSGRSKGVRSVVGFQSMPGLQAVYGDNIAKDLVGNLTNVSILRLECPDTAEWAKNRFGQVERFEYMRSNMTPENMAKHPERIGYNEALVERAAVMASEFTEIPQVRDGVVHGYHIVNAEDKKMAFRTVTQYPLIRSRPEVDYVPNELIKHVMLRPWTAEDEERTGVRLAPPDTDFDAPFPDPARSQPRAPVPAPLPASNASTASSSNIGQAISDHIHQTQQRLNKFGRKRN